MAITVDPRYRFRKRWLFLVSDITVLLPLLPIGATGTADELEAAGLDVEVFNTQNYLRLFPDASGTSTVLNWVGGESPKYDITSGGFSYSPAARQSNFKVQINDARRIQYRAIRKLANISERTGFVGQRPLDLLDFLFPEEDDEDTAMQLGLEPYTARRGLVRVKPNPMVGNNYDLQFMKEGFTLEFDEAALRLGMV